MATAVGAFYGLMLVSCATGASRTPDAPPAQHTELVSRVSESDESVAVFASEPVLPTAPTVSGETADWPPVIALAPSPELVALKGTGVVGDAMATLAATDYFATARVGRRRGPTPCTEAFAVVFAQPDNSVLFQQLVSGASVPGRLYGLCGLWLIDAEAYSAAVPAIEAMPEPVTYWINCSRLLLPAREIISSWDPAKQEDIASGAVPLSLRTYALEPR